MELTSGACRPYSSVQGRHCRGLWDWALFFLIQEVVVGFAQRLMQQSLLKVREGARIRRYRRLLIATLSGLSLPSRLSYHLALPLFQAFLLCLLGSCTAKRGQSLDWPETRRRISCERQAVRSSRGCCCLSWSPDYKETQKELLVSESNASLLPDRH